MHLFKHWGLAHRLAGGFATVVVTFIVSLAAVAAMLWSLARGVDTLAEKRLPMMVAVDRMDIARSEVQQFFTDVAATHDPAAYAEADEAARRFREAAAQVRTLLDQSPEGPAQLAELAGIERSFAAFATIGRRMAEVYLRDGVEAGNRLMKGGQGEPGFDQASASLAEQLGKFRDAQLAAAHAQAGGDRDLAHRTMLLLAASGLLATLGAAALATLIARRTLRELGGEPREAIALAGRMGAGDLSQPAPLRPGDQDSLLARLDQTQRELAAVVAAVRDRAQAVAATSTQLQEDSAALAGRTGQQASSLQQIAASMEALSSAVRENTDSARTADQMARDASDVTQRGGARITQFVGTMSGIDSASRRIADIIGVIDGIAFQTNILALNAAVEAARAGEQGRGFAVVAGEVRSLAGRSAESARTIKRLIASSIEQVDTGSGQIDATRQAMDQATADIARLADTIGRVAQAGAAQGQGVEQVAAAVQQVDRMTQQNATAAEQSAAAATRLHGEAAELAAAVARFRL